MKAKTMLAVLLIALGLVAFVYQVITYTSRGEDVVSASARLAIARTCHDALPSILGVMALVGGFTLLLVDTEDFEGTASDLR